MARFESEPVHVLHVLGLALEMFDGLADVAGLEAVDREVLAAAASLHDIGWSVTAPEGKGHHKESARLIREHVWEGIPAERVELVAQVARYHRKAVPSEADHEEFARLSADRRRRIRWLAGILRVADGLDRRHVQVVAGLSVFVGSGRLCIEVMAGRGLASRDVREEIEGAVKKADLLACASGCEVVIRAEPGACRPGGAAGRVAGSG